MISPIHPPGPKENDIETYTYGNGRIGNVEDWPNPKVEKVDDRTIAETVNPVSDRSSNNKRKPYANQNMGLLEPVFQIDKEGQAHRNKRHEKRGVSTKEAEGNACIIE